MKNKIYFGGIQKGQSATSKDSAKLDSRVKYFRDHLAKVVPHLKMKKKITNDDVPGEIGVCVPDGGAWFLNNVLVLILEAKHQNDAGNAIQRWFAKEYIARRINSLVSLVTFCTGAGASKIKKNGRHCAIYRELHVAHCHDRGGFDSFFYQKNSAYMRPKGFTDSELYDIMSNIIIEVLERNGFKLSHDEKVTIKKQPKILR